MTQTLPMFDAHAHIISDDLVSYPPSPISGRVRPGALDDPMTAERLIDLMDVHGVTQAALVQRAHIYGYDNSYVVDAAARYPDRFRAICVIDSNAADAADRADEWLKRGACGVRLTEPSRDSDGTWLHGHEARRVWDTVAAQNGSISIQLYTWNRAWHLPEIPDLLAHYAGVPVIVEHLSNLTETASGPDHGIDAALAALADFPDLILKLTTINLARCAANGVDARAVVRRFNALFTPERLIWGSDVSQSPQTYGEMTAMARAAVDTLDQSTQAAILSASARRLFSA